MVDTLLSNKYKWETFLLRFSHVCQSIDLAVNLGWSYAGMIINRIASHGIFNKYLH
jgi:hypothetical protein